MEARAVRENGLQRGVSDGAFSAWVRNGRVRQRQGRGDMLGRCTCKRWQKSETSKMKAYTGEWVLLRMVWRERIGCAGVSREVKQDGNTCTVVAGCAAASIAEVKLSLVVRMMLERHGVKERCCSCFEHVGPGDIMAQGGIEARAAACAAAEESLRPGRWGWSP